MASTWLAELSGYKWADPFLDLDSWLFLGKYLGLVLRAILPSSLAYESAAIRKSSRNCGLLSRLAIANSLILSAKTRHGHSGFVPFLFPGFSLRWGLTICARIMMLYMQCPGNWITLHRWYALHSFWTQSGQLTSWWAAYQPARSSAELAPVTSAGPPARQMALL